MTHIVLAALLQEAFIIRSAVDGAIDCVSVARTAAAAQERVVCGIDDGVDTHCISARLPTLRNVTASDYSTYPQHSAIFLASALANGSGTSVGAAMMWGASALGTSTWPKHSVARRANLQFPRRPSWT